MTTFGIKTEITMTTKDMRSIFSSFYKAFTTDSVNLKTPVVVKASETETFDLTDSSFVILAADTYGQENECLNITLTKTSGLFTIEGVSFLMLNASNIIGMSIENTSEEDIAVTMAY